ncbi:probable Serine/threonine-protein phosphatase 4 catalytic subunit [Saccharomycodes ludwigii]|uniref:Serine/threonine-protein phosphatase n=1 Tax=Saccharomycodes ludwigii TaxID=36035 RepID=A0A376B748_9ASCO|nr:hypothetical protein SCDLUD_001629 [Saccharomycodes ludwigii]KAH3901846.1 hypothetical protein SCDLUD_001629 [Saccharomycodes ludwigii]SSD60451.1 probable Serine/threonine-protein phosphatase 4 catalytic subunit [Saccharomycodes ludwigii]
MTDKIDKIIEYICLSGTNSTAQEYTNSQTYSPSILTSCESSYNTTNTNPNNNILSEENIYEICQYIQDLLIQEPNIAHIDTPVTICGDIHGQLHDLLNLFSISSGTNNSAFDDQDETNPVTVTTNNSNGTTTTTTTPINSTRTTSIPNFSQSLLNTRYIFLGDFVDRGFYSLETFLLLICLKIRYPDRIILVRGNHETRQITKVYGFYDECIRKYGNCNVWRYCCEVFDYLPLGCSINDGTIFCLHGGLSPDVKNLNEIRCIDRKQEVPHMGAMCDLLWSDPDELVNSWSVSPRGAGYLFGKNEVDEFRYLNNIDLIARAHQLVMEGYKEMFNKGLVTVWSAPNYCYRCGNVASVLTIDNNMNKTYKIFDAVPIKDNRGNSIIPNKKPSMDYFL